jgi:serine/threonine protein kinase|tara:strand:+ start:174 stop:374 length:201 start_codon:yes stop_codon:yes gene_type:complete
MEQFFTNPKKVLKSKSRWKKLSRKARSFVLELIAVDPSDRLTISSALQNEFLPGREAAGQAGDKLA